MAIARLHGGPLDGQVLPLESPELDSLIVPYGAGQVVYNRDGETRNTGTDDGPSETVFRYAEATDDIGTDHDDKR